MNPSFSFIGYRTRNDLTRASSTKPVTTGPRSSISLRGAGLFIQFATRSVHRVCPRLRGVRGDIDRAQILHHFASPFMKLLGGARAFVIHPFLVKIASSLMAINHGGMERCATEPEQIERNRK